MFGKKYRALTPLVVPLISFTLLLLASWAMNNVQQRAFIDSLRDSSTSAQKMSLLAQMAETARSRTRLTAQMLEERDIFERDSINLELNLLAGKFAGLRQQLISSGLSENELEMLRAQDAIIGKILPLQRQAAELAMSGDSGDLKLAKSLLYDEVLRGQSLVIGQLMGMIDALNQNVRRAAQKSQKQYSQSLEKQHILLVMTLAFVLFISTYTVLKVLSVERNLSAQRERAQATLTSIQDGVVVIDQQMRVTELNATALNFIGLGRNAIIDRSLEEMMRIAEMSVDGFLLDAIARVLDGDLNLLMNNELTVSVGQRSYDVDLLISPIVTDGEINGAIITFRDISEKKKLTKKIRYQARHDGLTDLLNRQTFEEECSKLFRGMKSDTKHVLCLLDLDRFKVVNDTSGHHAGDELLRQVAATLRNATRRGDLIARIGGDEFAVLLHGCATDDGLKIIENVIASISDSRFNWQGNSFAVGCSAGLVEVTSGMRDFGDLFHSADTACYLAKDEGRNRARIFDLTSSRLVDKKEESHWVNKINRAIEDEQFYVEVQPVMHAADTLGRVAKFELLVRLKEDGRTVLPMSFLPTAERYGLIGDIDLYVLEQAVKLLRNNRYCPMLSVNLSGKTLGDQELTGKIVDRLRRANVDLGQICFEITETAMIANLSNCQEFISQARTLGTKISLDDFGSGLSSFNYLDTLTLDYIKIDGVFIQKMQTSRKARAMVESINNIAHTIGVKTIAEFIDSVELVEISKELGIDYLQGYLLGRPRRPEDYGLRGGNTSVEHRAGAESSLISLVKS